MVSVIEEALRPPDELRRVPGRPAPDPVALRRTLVLAGCLAAAVVAGAVVVLDPVAAGLGLLGLLVVGAMVLRVGWALLVYVAVEPFGDLVGDTVPQGVKLVGLLLFAAWLVRVVVDRRPVAVRHPVVVAAGVLGVVVLAALVVHPNGPAGLQVAARYASYLAVLVVLVDTLRTTVPPRRVVTVFVVSATLAAAWGLATFLREGGRAAGPMEDANDFAFYLVCALPFALLLWREERGLRRVAAGVAVALLVVVTCATFSRGALLAVGVMVVVALLLGLLRVRDVVAATVAVGLGLGAVVASAPDLVERAFAEKSFVAQDNVDSRFTSWTLAAEMTADHPVLGVGPGGFAERYAAYDQGRSADPTHLSVVHQMYLDVSSELGLVGLAVFLGLIGAGGLAAWRGRAGDDPGLATAVVVALVGVLVAALFLSEQYYLPIWLLVALGAALDTAHRHHDATTGVPALDGRGA